MINWGVCVCRNNNQKINFSVLVMHKFADVAAKLVPLKLKKGGGGKRELALHNFHVPICYSRELHWMLRHIKVGIPKSD